jgi:death-on-curing protein
LTLVNNHPLVDGNKRLGWLACAVFLDINGTDPTLASDDDVFDLVMEVAGSQTEVGYVARRLREMIEPG